MIEPQIVFDPALVAFPRRRREIHRPPGRVELVEGFMINSIPINLCTLVSILRKLFARRHFFLERV
jgi:hypothetical protein